MQICNVYNSLNDLFITPEARTKAAGYFNRVRFGQDEDYRTPFWNEAPRESIQGEWIDRLTRKPELVPGLFEFEKEMNSKVGPLSIMAPLNERLDDIKAYYSCIQKESVPIDSHAISRYLDKIKRIKIHPLDVETTIKHMRLSTSSGIPYFMRKNKIIEETKKILYDDAYYIAILGWRGQEGGPDVEDVKQRVVWMFPFSFNIRELSAYIPLIQQWQAQNINSAYISIRAVEQKITKCFDTKDRDDYVVVTDFSKFDQHFNEDLQFAAQECLKSMLPTEAGQEWLKNVFPGKYRIPLLVSGDLLFTGKHGMGSGSGGTNFDECCAHSCLQEEAAYLAGRELNPYSNAYGDDGYLTYPRIDVDHVIKCYSSHGQDMNPDKQSVSKSSAVYLRRYFHYGYRDREGIMLGIYSTCRALGRLMGQERYYRFDEEVDYQRYVTLRAWSILENCCHHPYFTDFVDFVLEGDKFKLGLEIPGFMESFEKDFNKLRELDPDVLGYTKEQQTGNAGLKDWRIFKYLKSLK